MKKEIKKENIYKTICMVSSSVSISNFGKAIAPTKVLRIMVNQDLLVAIGLQKVLSGDK